MTEVALRGAVAQILNSRQLVINLGAEAGVKSGMKFAVLNAQGVDVMDPVTKMPLGSVPIAKVIVEVIRVEPKLSVARTFKTRRRNIGGSGTAALGLASLFEPPNWVEETETLRTAEKPQVRELSETESYVKIGDPVEQVLGDEYDTSPERS